jgi:hypothetical protein
MTTFNGSYVTEPVDLQAVCTEADIIACCDDPGGTDMRDVNTFAGLSAPQKAEVVAIMNTLIADVESTVNSYARRQGYAIPLSPVDALVRDVASRLLWIDLRQRAKGLTADAAEQLRDGFRRGTLADIAKGTLLRTATRATAPAPSSHVYKISDAATRDVEGVTPRMSRKTLEGW